MEHYFCNKCKLPITDIDMGVVIWPSYDKDGHPENLMIVHKVSCDDRKFPYSWELKEWETRRDQVLQSIRD